jgi:8-oxo-dGTP diphosphatase
MIPRFGPPPGHHSYRLRPGAYALLIRGDAALLTFQQAPEPEFQLPGGGIDPGESQLPALYREVREETGWSIGLPRRLGSYRRFCFMPDYDFWAEKLCHIWLARPIARLAPPSEPGHSAHWVPLAELPARLADPGARAFARGLLSGRHSLRTIGS